MSHSHKFRRILFREQHVSGFRRAQTTHCKRVCRGKELCVFSSFAVFWDAQERMDFHRRPRRLVESSSWEETASAVSRSTATSAAWVAGSSPHTWPGAAGAHGPRHVHCRSTCQGRQVGGRHQRSQRQRPAVSCLKEVLRVASIRCALWTSASRRLKNALYERRSASTEPAKR